MNDSVIVAVLAAALCIALNPHPTQAGPGADQSEYTRDLETLSGALRGSPALSVLDEDERSRFSGRVIAFFSVWNRTKVEEYESLMKSWGGVIRLDEENEAFREMRERDWNPIGSQCSIRSIDATMLSADIIAALGPDGMTATPWPINDGGGMGNIHYTLFRFGDGQDQVARRGAPVIQLIVPIETYDGSKINLSMRWIRLPASGDWVPWMIYQTVPPGDGVCVLYF
ncbi:MAG: hypothetical protein JNK58_06690 [Phycisphaerae bacterium]|nr:hypothetical protein [Phycisphaerae bacterium]